MTRLAALLAALIAFSAAPSVRAQVGALVIQDAWTRKAPGSDTAAVYLTLRNTSLQPVILIGVRAPGVTSALIHETSVKAGQSQMRSRDKIVIAPGQTFAFQPGGTHIMLSGIQRSYAIGQSVPLVFLLADGGQVQVAAVVRPLDAR